jgi:hypothetical protein
MFQLLRTRSVRPYRSSVAVEEERVWIAFYRRVADPAIAAEVIQHLDADADLKRTHSALYLSCKESLRRKKARHIRTKRIRSLMRKILRELRLRRESNIRPHLRHSDRVVLERLPESTSESGQSAPNALRVSAPRLDSAVTPRSAKAA